MDFLNQLVNDANSVLWGVFFLIPLLCGTGIFYTFKLRFVQIRKFGLAARFLLGGASLFGKRADKSGMSSFQALATAVAAQVGTGNVAGTATALVAGGRVLSFGFGWPPSLVWPRSLPKRCSLRPIAPRIAMAIRSGSCLLHHPWYG